MNILGIFLVVITFIFFIWQTISLVKDIRYKKKRNKEKSDVENNDGEKENNIGDNVL